MFTHFLFIFGTIIGSGINALDWREGQDKSWLTGSSQCPDCGHELSWWELVPILSFLYLGGSCSNCDETIGWQYPLVELAAGLLSVLIFQQFGVSLAGIFAAVVWSLLLLIYVHDGRTMIIPRWAVWTFNGLAFAGLFVVLPADALSFSQAAFITPGWLQIAAGPIVAAPLASIWLFSGGRAMGLGDGKLALGIGWLLGLAEAISAVMLAFWIGAAVSLALLGFRRLWKNIYHQKLWQSIIKLGQLVRLIDASNDLTQRADPQDTKNSSGAVDEGMTMKTAVPFGPFLILGLLVVYVTGLTLL